MSLGGKITGGLIAMDGIDQLKKVPKTYQDTSNKYDDILDTSMNKATNKMGVRNAVVANPKYAFDIVNECYDGFNKEAKIQKHDVQIIKQVLKDPKYISGIVKDLGKKTYNVSKKNLSKGHAKFEEVDYKNTQNIKELSKALKNKDGKTALKKGLLTGAYTLPMAAAVGKGSYELGKTIGSKTGNPEDNNDKLTPAIIGGVIASSLLGGAVAKKGFAPIARSASDSIKKTMTKQPKAIIKRTGPAGRFVVDTYEKAFKDVGKHLNNKKTTIQKAEKATKENINNYKRNYVLDVDKKSPKQEKLDRIADMAQARLRVIDNRKNNTAIRDEVGYKMFLNRKHAAAYCDQIEKIASVKSFGKKVITEDFFKEGLKSIPYAAAPAILGLALKRDVKHGFGKQTNINEPEIPVITIDKTASFNIYQHPKMLNAIKTTAEQGAKGLGRTVLPATVTALTGRDIYNSFNKVKNDSLDRNTQDGVAKVIIEVKRNSMDTIKGAGKAKRDTKRQMSNIIDDIYKSAKSNDEDDIGDINKELNDEVQEVLGNAKSVKAKKIYIGHGQKKQYRMNS